MTDRCPFCAIVTYAVPADIVDEWSDAVAFRPLNPVTPGHVLVVPRVHVPDFTCDPDVSALTMRRAAELVQASCEAINVISSAGTAATQTVFHLHLHLVPREPRDGLALPWTA